MGMTFAAGWFGNDHLAARKLTRALEERDAALLMSQEALTMSEKALTHSLNSAETLAICLGRIGIRPAEVVPSKRKDVLRDYAGLAGLQ